jgi:integrase
MIDIATIVFFTGMRSGEICRLRWRDIDFKGRSILIVSDKQGSTRRVPFAGKVLAVLKARQPNSEFVLGRFPERTMNRASRLLSDLSAQVRTGPLSFWLLRESFIWHWMQAGGNCTQLACITGYAVLRWNRKNLISPDSLYAAAARFQAQLEEPETVRSNPAFAAPHLGHSVPSDNQCCNEESQGINR